ncbi:MAG: TetR/AcrR family transcriptional regulator [Acidobacteriia bacterium]|nr:TetR/AcrR family transcriptional regulator [Terriglobia bacterium]
MSRAMRRHKKFQIPMLRTARPAPAAPTQARSTERRAKLLKAGRLLFGKKGYEATSIGEITSRAGAASGAFYQYFSSKQQFLIALMNELIERLSRLDLRPKPGGNMRTSLRRFLAAAFRVDSAYYGVVRAWQEAVLTDRDLGRMQRKIELWTQARVLGVLERLRQHPNALSGRDLPTFAPMMDRHFWSLLARGSSLTPRQFSREVKVAADVIYHYLFGDPRSK